MIASTIDTAIPEKVLRIDGFSRVRLARFRVSPIRVRKGQKIALKRSATRVVDVVNIAVVVFFIIMGVLTVYLDKVLHLLNEEWLGKSSPYVKFHLVQDGLLWDGNYGVQKSSKKPRDLSPVYDETFVFKNVPTLDSMELHVTVLDDDGFLYDDKMGKVAIKLDDLDLTEEFTGIDRPINNYWFHKDGRIFLQLSYSKSDDYVAEL